MDFTKYSQKSLCQYQYLRLNHTTTTTTTTVYFNEIVFPSVLGLTSPMPSHNILLHLDLSQASSLQSPFSLISSLNTSLQLFLGLPFTPSPSTRSVSILFIQHNSSLLSTWPNHLNLFHCMTSNIINCQHAPHTHYCHWWTAERAFT